MKIHPTAIVLHWWGGRSGGRGINTLVDVLNSRRGSVQLGTLQNGKTYQLTDTLETRAAHASCANSYAIGNEIEGGGNGTSSDLINNASQFNAVVDTTAFLMRKYEGSGFMARSSFGRSIDRISQPIQRVTGHRGAEIPVGLVG